MFNSDVSTSTTTGSLINFGDCGVQNVYCTGIHRENTRNNTYNPIQFGAEFYQGRLQLHNTYTLLHMLLIYFKKVLK